MASLRSYINCLRCYDLSKRLGEHSTNPETELIRVQLEEHQHAARDRALQSIDEVIASVYDNGEDITAPEKETINEMKNGRCLCYNCDSSRPSLAIYLKEMYPGDFPENNEEAPKPK